MSVTSIQVWIVAIASALPPGGGTIGAGSERHAPQPLADTHRSLGLVCAETGLDERERAYGAPDPR
jgi:hypothetical protein